jgi:hypothetical protein
MDDDLPFIVRSEAHGSRTPEGRRLRAACAEGSLHRLAPGCFVDAAAWADLFPRQRHVLEVRALQPRVPPGARVSHVSAAALYGWADLDTLPSRIHLIDPAAAATQSRRGTIRHAASVRPDETWLLDGIVLTSPLRTAVDVALTCPFAGAVAALDDALKREDVTREALLVALDSHAARRGRVAARRAIEFADERAGSAAESLARVVLMELGAPVAELQRAFRLPHRTTADAVDFFFAEQGVVLEVDGRGKYTDRKYLRGSTPANAFIGEKEREQRLFACAEVRRIIRCGWRDLRYPARLRRMLLASGIPVAR